MKKTIFVLSLFALLAGCGGGGSNQPTITLKGSLTQGVAQGGQGGNGNPATSGTVTITELNKSASVTSAAPGVYSIPDVPVGGNYTVHVTEPNSPTVNVTCPISIPDSTTLTIGTASGGTCTRGSGNIGDLVLDIATD